MDEKTLATLEFHKVLDRLAGLTAFAVSAEKARALRPTTDLEEAEARQAATAEALQLQVTHADLTIGGARDVRAAVDLAQHGGTLPAADLLDIKFTLIAARSLARSFERLGVQYPHLAAILANAQPPFGLVDVISRTLSDRGEVLDSASDKLRQVRHDLRIAHERLMTRLQRMVNDPKNGPLLQEAIITQRDGRYVIPLRAEFKGRIKSIVHDQSSSGATLFVEPLAVVDLNNAFRELELAERDEERRILSELSHQVGQQGAAVLATVASLADLDLALACGRLAEVQAAVRPRLHPIRASGLRLQGDGPPHPGTVIRLYAARHPLLDPATVVPIDVDLDRQTYALIITGPNTGGKTVTLKTVGLLALMAQAGLHVPAASGSEISVFQAIYADIGDEQSIEQSLSTFSGHITNIIHILERADRQSLVILDELGAGTDPQEGAALARSLLSSLLNRSITTLVTTHHPELKAFAHATPGVVNASAEFDLETLRPTYHLTIGLPGRSNALAIAQRLGLPEAIITAARAELDPSDLRAEDLLDEIHRQRDLSRQARAEAEKSLQQAEAARLELLERLDKLEDERRAILTTARQEAAAEVESVQEELRAVRRQLARARQPLEALEAVADQVAAVSETVEQVVARETPTLGPQAAAAVEAITGERRRALRLGDKVRLRSLNAQGVVTSLGAEEAEVQVGILRVRARLSDLETLRGESLTPTPAAPRPQPAPSAAPARQELSAPSPGMELDLRGQRAEDALDSLERYLDSAYLAGLPFVRIIHGKGTGKLRQVIREALQGHPQIRSFEGGSDKEGGEGVTVVKLAAS